MIFFYIGLAVGGGVELLGRMSQWANEEAEGEETSTKEPTFSISNGTIFKSLLGFGLIEWIFGRKK
jgi:hypothetical protein